MNSIVLLDELKAFTIRRTRDLPLPVQPTPENRAPAPRAADVYVPCLPDLRSYESKAPFITHEVIKTLDRAVQERGAVRMRAAAVVRTCFCVYHENSEEGALALLDLMERFRFGLLEEIWLGDVFKLDIYTGLESEVYPEDPYGTKKDPFHIGETVSAWALPAIERKVRHGQNYGNIERPGPRPRCQGGGPGAGETAPHEGGAGRR